MMMYIAVGVACAFVGATLAVVGMHLFFVFMFWDTWK